jgi:putative transposase
MVLDVEPCSPVVRAGQEPLSRLMKPLNTGFAMWLSSRLKGSGPVFADRFKSILVDEEEYLLELIRYVHNNPVRAGVVLDPSSSEWSSHRAYMGMEDCPPWLNIGYILSMFSSNSDEARRLFHQFVLEGKDERRRPDLSGDGLKNMGRDVESGFGDGWRISGPILGDKAFAAKVLDDISAIDEMDRQNVAVSAAELPKTPTLPELVGATCIALNLEPWEFDDQPKKRQPALARRIVAYLWVKRYKKTQIEIARHLNVTTGAVSRWYAKAVGEITLIESMCDMVETMLSKSAQSPSSPRTDTSIIYNLQFEEES